MVEILLKKFYGNKKIRLFILLLVFIFALTFSINAELKVHFIDVGQGDSILIQEDNTTNILIDGGNRWNSVEDKVVGYLRNNNVDTIDALIATHAHADHIGSLEAVMNNFKVEQIYDSGKIHTSKTYENYLLAVDQNDIPFNTPRRGDILSIDDLEFKVLHPTNPVEKYNLNSSSIVLHLNYGEVSFLFTGDIEKEVERDILNSNLNIKSTILKTPHHGSKTSSSDNFIAEVSPEVAVITVGEDNKFDHPSPETISLFQKRNIAIYRTDMNEDIVIISDGKGYSIETDQKHEQKTVESPAEISEVKDSKPVNENLLNINTADAAKLDILWGVGPATAEKIIKYRENNNGFKSIEEIKNVNGIDEKKFNKWKNEITI